MERSELISKLTNEAKEAGISEKRLNQDMRPTYLPKKGKFVGYKIEQPNTVMSHFRLITECGNSISVSGLKAMAFFGTPEKATFRMVTDENSVMKGGYVLIGTRQVNPHISGKMVEIVADWIGKEFTAKPLDLVTVNVSSKDNKIVPYTSEDEARKNLITKTYYEVKAVE